MRPSAINWLASFPKSGNTWIRMMLAAYRYGSVDINGNADVSQQDTDGYSYCAVSPYSVDKLDAEILLYLRHAVLVHLGISRRRKEVVMKTHCANVLINNVELIPLTLSGTATYVVRDPRDVVVSYARHVGSTIDQAIATLDSLDAMMFKKEFNIPTWTSSWSKNVTSWIDKDDVLCIKYEDMKADTGKQFTRVLENLKIPVDEERVAHAVELCELSKLRAQEDERGFIELAKQEKFFGSGKGWKNELTDKQIRRVEEDHGEVMTRLGYELMYT